METAAASDLLQVFELIYIYIYIALEFEEKIYIPEMGDKKSSSLVCDLGAWTMNVVSSVGIIMANKELMSPLGFGFAFG